MQQKTTTPSQGITGWASLVPHTSSKQIKDTTRLKYTGTVCLLSSLLFRFFVTEQPQAQRLKGDKRIIAESRLVDRRRLNEVMHSVR